MYSRAVAIAMGVLLLAQLGWWFVLHRQHQAALDGFQVRRGMLLSSRPSGARVEMLVGSRWLPLGTTPLLLDQQSMAPLRDGEAYQNTTLRLSKPPLKAEVDFHPPGGVLFFSQSWNGQLPRAELTKTVGLPGAWLYQNPFLLLGLVLLIAGRKRRQVDEPESVQVGGRLGRYRLVELLGEGGMAQVFRARPLEGTEEVAIKIIRPHFATSAEFRQRFEEREMSAGKQLEVPGVVRVLDWGCEQHLYLVMELLDGGTLRGRIEARPQLEQAVRWLGTILESLQGLHEQGIIHRDLKPENLLFDRSGNLKISDLGLARGDFLGDTLTATEEILGTPQYMAPEQLLGVNSPSVDLYAVGVIGYELLTGQRPFPEPDVGEVAFAHLSQEATPASELNPAIPPQLEAVVMRLLANDAQQRYPSAAAALTALKASGDALSRP